MSDKGNLLHREDYLPDRLDPQMLLRGEYEAQRLPDPLDSEYPVPRFGNNVVNQCGCQYIPILDEQWLDNEGREREPRLAQRRTVRSLLDSRR